MADYPDAITSLTNPASTDRENNPSHSEQHINANDEIEAIEKELGISPKGTYATVVARLDDIDPQTTLQEAFDNGQSITIADTDNQSFKFTNNDTTNNNNAFEIGNATTGNGLFIDQNGNGIGLNIDSEATSANTINVRSAQTSGIVCAIRNYGTPSSTATLMYLGQTQADHLGKVFGIDNSGVGKSFVLNQVGVLAAHNQALRVYSTVAHVNYNSALAYIHSSSATATEPSLEVNYNGLGDAQEINNSGTGMGLNLQQTGVLAASHYGLRVYSNAVQVNSSLVDFRQDNASSTSDVVKIQNDGTGHGLFIDQNGVGTALNVDNSAAAGPGIVINESSNGTHLRLTGDPTVASPVDGDFWFDGTNLRIQIGTGTFLVNLTEE